MSKYSGTDDFYDYIEKHGIKSILSSDIYLGSNILVPLKITNIKDCIPFYPYIILISYIVPSTDHSVIHLSQESYIDTAERKHLTYLLETTLSYYNKCNRLNIPFTTEQVLKIMPANTSSESCKEIVQRVIQNNLTIENIYDTAFNQYRDKLFLEMINNEYPPSISYYWLWHNYLSQEGLNAKMLSLM